MMFAFLITIIRVVIPVGLMPSLNTNHSASSFALILCTAEGHVSVVVDENGTPQKPKKSSNSNKPCAFCGNISVAALPISYDQRPVLSPAIKTKSYIANEPERDARLKAKLKLRGPPLVS